MINHNSEAVPSNVLSTWTVLRGNVPYYQLPHHTYFNIKAGPTAGHPQVIHQCTPRQTTEWKNKSEAGNSNSPSFSLLLHNGWLNKVTSAPHHIQNPIKWCFVISVLHMVRDQKMFFVTCFTRNWQETGRQLLTQILQQCHKLASHAAGPSRGLPQTAGWPRTSGSGRTLWTEDLRGGFIFHGKHLKRAANDVHSQFIILPSWCKISSTHPKTTWKLKILEASGHDLWKEELDTKKDWQTENLVSHICRFACILQRSDLFGVSNKMRKNKWQHLNNFTTGQWLPATATINQRVSEGKWAWHSDIRLPHPYFLIYSWSDAQKRLWTSENEGLGPMRWLSITAGKSRVMSQRLNSSFISPPPLHAQVSSSLSVLIVSIPKFDCRSLCLSHQPY